jgi:thioredoxin-related protein
MYKKKLYFFVVMSVIFSTGLLSSISAQTQLMPSFTMKLTNGKIFSSKELSPQKPVIIIYFAPDCDHCQVLMNALFKKINEFKRSEIVIEKTYQTAKYSNIKVGTEAPIFFFRTYYHLENTPFTVLFDKHGKQIISYKKETPVDDLIKHLKLLK